MKRGLVAVSALGLVTVAGSGAALAAPNWDKVPSKKITVFYPGTAAMEWVTKRGEHGGAKGLGKGETCISCHQDEKGDVDVDTGKILSGEKLEPKPVKGKVGTIPVTVQAAHDANNLYLRFQFKAPPGGGDKMDKDNPLKLAVMLEDNKIDIAKQAGCWGACHQDARTMPNAKSDTQTKYVVGGSLASGKFYDLMQFKSGKGQKSADGYVADKRVMEGGKALVSAEGKNVGGTWTVTFTRKLAGGGTGKIALAPGKTYNFGFAIHDDYSAGRFHHVSFGYTLGLDNAKTDIDAVKQ